MNDPTTIGVELAVLAEMRWAIARLDRKVAALEETKADKPSRRGHAIARAGLWMIAGMLVLSGCTRGAAPALAAAVPPATPEATATTAAVLSVLPWVASILAVAGVACAVLAIALRELGWMLGTMGAAAGIFAAVALEWIVPFMPWVVLAAVAAGLAYGVWRLVLYRRAVIATAAHGDRMEALHGDQPAAPVELLTAAKMTSLREQAAHGVHDLIAAARRKPLKG